MFKIQDVFGKIINQFSVISLQRRYACGLDKHYMQLQHYTTTKSCKGRLLGGENIF